MQQEIAALTVSQLNRQIRLWLENEIAEVTVLGEVSNLTKPNSGHFYFTLKDSEAQLRCVYFRNYHSATSKNFKDGQQVLAKGRLSIYEARGDYQLIIYSLSEAGLGELYFQFEELKAKLKAQGLFDTTKKKSIPRFPAAIGIITSPSGAALHDILTTLGRRYPLARVKIYPSEVQGKDASSQLIQALKQANQEQETEVLILARGGGSIEDLWAFNNEKLTIAISQSTIPVVTGIGHETDFTIADFVADLRAATPTAAAEAVTPNQHELLALLKDLEQRIIFSVLHCTKYKQLLLSQKIAKVLSPQQLIAKHWQTLDFVEKQLHQCFQGYLTHKKNILELLSTRLAGKNPQTLLIRSKIKIHALEQQLFKNINERMYKIKEQLTAHLATLHAVSPLATLERGYAIASHQEKIIFKTTQVKKGDRIKIQLAQGYLHCEVNDLNKDNK
jgi:exodeoxyribonuclease VII large subunit